MEYTETQAFVAAGSLHSEAIPELTAALQTTPADQMRQELALLQDQYGQDIRGNAVARNDELVAAMDRLADLDEHELRAATLAMVNWLRAWFAHFATRPRHRRRDPSTRMEYPE